MGVALIYECDVQFYYRLIWGYDKVMKLCMPLWKLRYIICMTIALHDIMFVNNNIRIACVWVYGSIVSKYEYVAWFYDWFVWGYD